MGEGQKQRSTRGGRDRRTEERKEGGKEGRTQRGSEGGRENERKG